ncbi:MAG: long-chain-fatty-acid--CoA ligase [Deltaproteobacteria bacterium HGW-Deltaproteobacteria-12]|jgi:long-chain acyl-CoA synthetase|nr:MAG: long-chain-fatty-acid--CoA ligase [Deltaproteobacteria bacterium HGW-Deltaproteobacteria-12]
MNLARLIEDAAQNFADRPALICENQRINYQQLNGSVNAVAHLLQQLGVVKGDKVALMLPNIPEFVYCYFAAVKLGAIAVPLNTYSTAYELSYLLENSDAKVLITIESARKRYEEIQDKLSSCKNLIIADSGDHNSPLKKALAQGPFSNPEIPLDPDDPAVMIYTSGLTGKPLGAVLTHINLYSQTQLIVTLIQRTSFDKGLSLIPLFHSFGATANMNAVLRCGCSVVMLDRFTMDSLFNVIEKEKITYICAVPRLYLGMMFFEGAAKYDISSLNVCVTGGSTMPADFITAFEKQFGVKILEGYGLTEAAPVCSFTRRGMVQKPGSIGTAIPDAVIKIVDETGHELRRGEIGELIVRGKNVMKGYYKDEAATASVIKDGWLYTGDLGKMDQDDYIFLTGRKKRMIITSAFNVYPREVENVLNQHPAVLASRIVAKADLMRGEIVKAEIIKKDGVSVSDKEIMKHCRIYLSPYKVPREVEFVTKLED